MSSFLILKLPIFQLTNISEWFEENVPSPIMNDMEDFQGNEFSWRLKFILYLNVHICKYGTMHAGSSYIDFPDMIINKQACINVINRNNNHCFNWNLLSALFTKKL